MSLDKCAWSQVLTYVATSYKSNDIQTCINKFKRNIIEIMIIVNFAFIMNTDVPGTLEG